MAYPPPPYADARCGTPVCGEAICGAWWAYATRGGLALGGSLPQVLIGEIVPQAGLALGAFLPVVTTQSILAAPQAGLAIGARAPTYTLSSTLVPPPGGLALGATIVGVFIGQVMLFDLDCLDLDLAATPVLSLDLDDLVCLP